MVIEKGGVFWEVGGILLCGDFFESGWVVDD